MKKRLTALLVLLLILCGCKTPVDPEPAPKPETPEKEETPVKEPVLKMFIEDKEIAVTWENNETVLALKELTKNGDITIRMSMYGGWEQVGPLGASLPADNHRITTRPGDIVLYSGNQIVVFYGPNTWEYTMLGHMDGLSDEEITRLLDNGDITLTLSLE